MARTLKFTCGDIQPSGCVIYTGEFPDFIDSDALSCDLNLDEVLKLYGDKINALLVSTDLTALDKKDLDFDPATITIKGLHQVEINKLFSLQNALDSLQAAFDGLNIGSKLITIDLDCLTPVASPCAQGTNQYSLLSILQIFKQEICAIKAHLNL